MLQPSGNARPPAAAEPQALPTADTAPQMASETTTTADHTMGAFDSRPSDGCASFAAPSGFGAAGSSTVSRPMGLPPPRLLGATNSAQPQTPADAVPNSLQLQPTRPQGMLPVPNQQQGLPSGAQAQAVQLHEVSCTFSGTAYDDKGKGPVKCNPSKRGEGASDPSAANQKKRAHTSAINATGRWTENAEDFKRVDTHRFGGAADVYAHSTMSIHILQMCILISSLRASGWLCVHITKCILRPMLRTHICVVWVRCVYTYALCILNSPAAAVVQVLRICII